MFVPTRRTKQHLPPEILPRSIRTTLGLFHKFSLPSLLSFSLYSSPNKMSATRLASISRLSLPLHQQHQHFLKQLPTRLQPLSRPLFLNSTIIARHKHSMTPNDNFALPVPTKADAKVLAEASRSTKSTYQLLYFPMHGRGELTRTLLVFSGAKWEELPLVSISLASLYLVITPALL